MQIDTFDLSVDRSVNPEISKAPRSGEFYAQVVRADYPASLHIDGASSEATPAIPGVVIDNFETIHVSNVAQTVDDAVVRDVGGGGKLVLAYYRKCGVAPGSASPFPYATVLAEGEQTNAAVDLTVEPPGPDWNVVVSGVMYGYDSAPGAGQCVVTFRSPQSGSVNSISILRDLGITNRILAQRDFSMPLIGASGWSARLNLTAGGAGVVGSARIFGQIIR